jgi:cobyrinic acid a,c-diamide synthase
VRQPPSKRGLLIAAPSSGAGKTTITLGLLRALKRRGVFVSGAKSGPDYIDPRFHEAACAQTCFNLDAWAMTEPRLNQLSHENQSDIIIFEGAMGLFDGAFSPDPMQNGKGASADLARQLELPVLLVVDAARMSQSIVPLVAGFAGHDPQVHIKGLILNKVGSERHAAMLKHALKPLGIPVLGCVPRSAQISHPDRHLGLVQACERPDLEYFLDQAADTIEAHVDLDAILALAAALPKSVRSAHRVSPPAQRISIAQDEAFAFAYPHILADWQAAGAELSFFSPLNDEAPIATDFIYLPGGYPELHADKISQNTRFLNGLRAAAHCGSQIYGECGGYMVLGEGLIDKDGTRHSMAGLLPLETSFETRKLHLGYRSVTATSGPFQGNWAAHEFHYATTLSAKGTALFDAHAADGTKLEAQGLIDGSVSGSFMHLIDQVCA